MRYCNTLNIIIKLCMCHFVSWRCSRSFNWYATTSRRGHISHFYANLLYSIIDCYRSWTQSLSTTKLWWTWEKNHPLGLKNFSSSQQTPCPPGLSVSHSPILLPSLFINRDILSSSHTALLSSFTHLQVSHSLSLRLYRYLYWWLRLRYTGTAGTTNKWRRYSARVLSSSTERPF